MHEVERFAGLVFELVGVREPVEGLRHHPRGELGGDLLALFAGQVLQLAQVHPVDQLHRNVELLRVLVLAQLEDLDEVRMLEHGRDACLVFEHSKEVVVFDELREDTFEGAPLLETAGSAELGQEQLGHPARRDLPDEFVPPDLLEQRVLLFLGHPRI